MKDVDQHPLFSPESAEIHQVLAAIESSRKMDDLLDTFEEGATTADIASALGCSVRGVLHALIVGYYREGRTEEAERIARAALDVSPHPVLHNDLLRVLLASPAPSDVEYARQAIAWSELYEKPFLQPNAWTARVIPRNRRWRIGVMCDYGFTNIGTHGIRPMFEAMSQYSDIAYYNFGEFHEMGQNDALHCYHVENADTATLEQRIRDDRIDLLIDLNGRLRTRDRLDMVLRQPAPFQATWYNQMGTSGLSVMDWIIADQHACPVADDGLFTEQVIRLRESTGCFVLPQSIPVVPPPVERERIFTFGSFHDGFKLNNRVLNVWARILQEAPNTRLVIKSVRGTSRRFHERIRQFFFNAKIDPGRIQVEPPSHFNQYLVDYNRVDLALDTFPYHGGTTNINALWQGIPALSLVGDHWRSRNTWSQQQSVGLTEFAAFSEEEYVRKAIDISRDPGLLHDLRLTMRDRLEQSAFFNPDIFARDFAAALTEISDTSTTNSAPAINAGAGKTIEIPPSFLIVGAQKAGTTSAHQILSAHPQLVGSSVGEVDYFFQDSLYQRGAGWYHSHFSGRLGQLSYEASPAYLCCPKVAARIADYNPGMKLILFLRDPVERAYSAWNMYHQAWLNLPDAEKSDLSSFLKPFDDTQRALFQHRLRPDPRTFEEAIGEELAAIQSGWVARLNQPLEPGCGFQLVDYVRRGLYIEQIEHYLEHFPPNQLLILDSRELDRNLSDALQSITAFLGIEPFATIPRETKMAVSRYTSGMDPGIRELLSAYYRPFNQKLYQLLGVTWDWDA